MRYTHTSEDLGRWTWRLLAWTTLVWGAGAALLSEEAQAQSKLLIVPFEQEGDGVQALYNGVMTRVKADTNQSQDYRVADVEVQGKITDLLFEVGCADVNPECLQSLGQSLGVDAILWGKLWKNDRGILLEIRLFDILSNTYVTEPPIEKSIGTENKPAEVEETAWYTDVVVGEFQQIFFPYAGEMTVATSEPGAKILFDGSEVGTTDGGPVSLTGRPLGEHLVTARIDDREVTQSVILLRGQTNSVTIDMSKANTAVVTDSGHIGSITSGAIGGVFLVGGVIMSFLVQGANDDSSAEAEKPVIDADAANTLRSDGNLYETLQWISYGVGSVALLTGGILYFFVEDSGAETAPADVGASFFGPVPLEGGAGFLLEGRF